MQFDIQSIGSNFEIFGEFLVSVQLSSGHINDTFAAAYNQGGTIIRYVHQRINHLIFKDPVGQMDNIRRVTSHIQKKMHIEERQHFTRETLTVVPSRQGLPYFIDNDSNYWRTYVLIEGARSFDVASSPDQAYQAARAFGRFQRLLRDLPEPRLNEIIPGFHNTPKRVAALESAIADDSHRRVDEARAEIEFAMDRKPIADTLLTLFQDGKIPERIVHNDTKFNNVLLDEVTGDGLCVVDLDTVMPGLSLYDFGDMVRTTTSFAAEDETNLEKVGLEVPMFEGLVRGFLEETRHFLSETELSLLAFSGKLITYEIGVRFLTDFLSGDKYFKIHREGHNLDRCRNQFKLVQSIEEQESAMQDLVHETNQALASTPPA